MSFSEEDVIQLYEWFGNLEARIQPIIEVMPVAGKKSLYEIVSPRIVPILIESCSIIDSIFRLVVPERMTRPNGKPITRYGANINDYCREMEPSLSLIDAKTIVLIPIPFVLSPFAGWVTSGRNKMSWWNMYNHLKHDQTIPPRSGGHI